MEGVESGGFLNGQWIEALAFVLAAAAVVVGRYLWERSKAGQKPKPAIPLPAPHLLSLEQMSASLTRIDENIRRMAASVGDHVEYERRHQDNAELAQAITRLAQAVERRS